MIIRVAAGQPPAARKTPAITSGAEGVGHDSELKRCCTGGL